VTLEGRAEIANKAEANLFISVHINAIGRTSPNGFSVHVLGQSSQKNRDLYANNMEIVRRENSVILMEDDYTTKYQGYDPNNPESAIFFNLMQNAYFEQSLKMAELCQKQLSKGPISTNRGIKQGALLVLWRTTMPSVLVEMGFITNKSDRNTLASKEKRTQLASRLFAAFKEFKEQYDGTVSDVPSVQPPVVQKEEPAVKNEPAVKDEPAAAEASADSPYYAIQIFAVSRNLSSNASEFKGLKQIGKFPAGSIFKYTTGNYKTTQEAQAALSSVRAKFKDAFVVKIEAGKAEKVR
jgi:N-acetylmuramoyl-L-alanine amidase